MGDEAVCDEDTRWTRRDHEMANRANSDGTYCPARLQYLAFRNRPDRAQRAWCAVTKVRLARDRHTPEFDSHQP